MRVTLQRRYLDKGKVEGIVHHPFQTPIFAAELQQSIMVSLLSFMIVLAMCLCDGVAFVVQSNKAHWGLSSSGVQKIRTANLFFEFNVMTSSLNMATSQREEALRIIIAGAPASGKGTQCEIIKEKFGVVHLSTGDMLRAAVAAGTEVGQLAKEYMDSGRLVPDDVIIGVVSFT